jgi:hypothetical protein
VVSIEGQEIVGLGYSTCMHLAGQRGDRKNRSGQSLMGSGGSQEKADLGGKYIRGTRRGDGLNLNPE